MSKRKNIYIAYTGGTIGMQPSSQGYIPTTDFITEQMAQMPELKNTSLPNYTIGEFPDPIDSSNIHYEHWNQIAKTIAEHYEHYDGFIILHGTDTMAYTAAALSFMLETLNKPVIFTGSQLPLLEVRNDARSALITSLLLASQCDIPEVCLYFGQQLFRGNRARKISAHDFSAFASPNCSPLATLGIDIKMNQLIWHYQIPASSLQIQYMQAVNIICVRLFPGLSFALLEQVLQQPLQVLILETYGSGNAPNNQAEFLQLLKTAIDRGIIIVNVTQCWHGEVNMQQYATGKTLADIGVISAYDMTPETTIAKLYYLFSKQYSLAEIKQLMQVNLRGEMSVAP